VCTGSLVLAPPGLLKGKRRHLPLGRDEHLNWFGCDPGKRARSVDGNIVTERAWASGSISRSGSPPF